MPLQDAIIDRRQDPQADFIRTITRVDMLTLIQNMSQDDILDFLKAEHPEYESRKAMYRELGDVSLNRLSDENIAEALLVQFKTEPDPFFELRKILSKFMPETPSILDNMVARCFRLSPKRTYPAKKESELTEFVTAAGWDEEQLTDISKKAARNISTFGSVDAVLDRPAEEGTESPFVTLYTPEDRIDWQADEKGSYKWVKYRNTTSVKGSFSDKRVVITEYRIFRAPLDAITQEGRTDRISKGWQEIYQIRKTGKDGKDKVFAFDSVTGGFVPHDDPWQPVFNDFHAIPVVTAYLDRIVVGVGVPWVTPMVRADVKCYRQESDIVWDTSMHAHPWLKYTGNDLDAMKLGGNFAVHLKPATEELPAEELEYLALDSTPIELQRNEADKSRDLARRFSGRQRDASIDSGAQPESGLAIQLRISEEAIDCIQLADAIQEWEWRILELVALEGEANPDNPSFSIKDLVVTYPDRFDQRTKEELSLDLDMAGEVGSPLVIREVRKTLAALLLGSGATDEMIQEANAEIDAGPVSVEAEEGEPSEPEDEPEENK